MGPIAVSGLDGGVGALTAGWHHTCAQMLDGRVLCWGRNDKGQLGRDTGVRCVVEGRDFLCTGAPIEVPLASP